jgi:hypothetical protein
MLSLGLVHMSIGGHLGSCLREMAKPKGLSENQKQRYLDRGDQPWLCSEAAPDNIEAHSLSTEFRN